MTTYTVSATRDGSWWSLIAADVDGREVASQSRRLDQADGAIREAIALVRDVDEDSFDVEVIPTLDQTSVSDETIELLELRRELARLGERSRRLTPQAVTELRAAGLTVRDVAELLGVTPSRVSQIEHRSPMTRRRRADAPPLKGRLAGARLTDRLERERAAERAHEDTR